MGGAERVRDAGVFYLSIVSDFSFSSFLQFSPELWVLWQHSFPSLYPRFFFPDNVLTSSLTLPVMDDSIPTPVQQKRPRVAEENRKRAVRAYVIILFNYPNLLPHALTWRFRSGAMVAAE